MPRAEGLGLCSGGCYQTVESASGAHDRHHPAAAARTRGQNRAALLVRTLLTGGFRPALLRHGLTTLAGPKLAPG